VRQGVAAPVITRDSKGAILLKKGLRYKEKEVNLGYKSNFSHQEHEAHQENHKY
jgi:hypothetical protein